MSAIRRIAAHTPQSLISNLRSQIRGFGLLGLLLILFPFAAALTIGDPSAVDPEVHGLTRLMQLANSGGAKFWQGMLIQVFIFAVFALSYDLLLGYTGMLSFGHALFFGTGGYVVGILLKHFDWPLWQAVLAVILVSVIQSLVIGALSLRVKGVYFAMVTLAFAQMFFILAEATDFRAYTGADDGLHGIPVPSAIDPTHNRVGFYFLALAFCGAMYLVVHRVVHSPTGRVMIAIRENENRAAMIGYNTFVYKLIAVVLAGVLAALAGMLNALYNLGVTPTVLHVNTTINVLLMTIIGGIGTLSGPMLGAGVLQLLGYWLNRLFGSHWQLIFGLVFVLIVVFLPYGIVGTWRMQVAGSGTFDRLKAALQIVDRKRAVRRQGRQGTKGRRGA